MKRIVENKREEKGRHDKESQGHIGKIGEEKEVKKRRYGMDREGKQRNENRRDIER